jgi:diketogulonate reductase-like aldo/keto reductase
MEFVSVQGEEIPAIGLGTYQLRGQSCVDVVQEALDLGYRHIDTAEYYNNQQEVGRAIRSSAIDREDVFLTTKVWRSNLAYDDFIESAEQSLDKLGLDYVDLLLIHWPSRSVPIEETVEAMTKLHDEGKTRHIGVSNFSVSQLQEARTVSDAPILTDQVEYNPFTGQSDLIEYCIGSDVMATAYSPLAKGKVAKNETLLSIGDRYEKTATQVALRWLVQQDMVSAIPKASSRSHLEENIDIFDFELTNEEMETVFELHRGIGSKLRDALGL